MKTPIIGITGDITFTKFYRDFWNYRSGINDAYIRAVERAKGIPLILPVSKKEYASSIISTIDGLILSGGNDVTPSNYNEEPIDSLGSIDPHRDEFELSLLKEAINQDIPVLCICRGIQLLNVLFGGSLYQDTLCNPKFNIQHSQRSEPHIPIHSIRTKKGSFINSILGDEAKVNSIHHQMINKLGKGLESTAESLDGVIESIEKKDSKFVVGVQWHPEILSKDDVKMQNIFNELILHTL